MPDASVSNWFGDIVSHPAVVVDARTVEDIVAVLKDPVKYPSPVRAMGSYHSTSECAAADGGTIIRMGEMNRILSIGEDTVTVEGGALYIDVAKQLEQHGLQFYVNAEIGSLSVGSAASCGTKDSSLPGEFGQAGSYATRIKMVLPSGKLLEVTAAEPEVMQKVRSSYGAFGVIYEVTFQVRPMAPLAVYHETFTLKEFTQKLPALKARGESMMFYIFPFDGLITVEFRHYNRRARGKPDRHIWALRNYLWATTGPQVCANAERDIADPAARYGVIDGFNALWRFKLENLIRSNNTVAADQIIRYPKVAHEGRYTFTFAAFPEENFPHVLAKAFAFFKKYFKQTGYRINMLCVGYRVAKDRSSLLSYSWDGDVMTVDPVSTGGPGWRPFLKAYNEFCSGLDGIPLLNQTWGLTRPEVEKAFGERLALFEAARRHYDPAGRLLNAYFRELVAADGGQAAAR